MTSLHDGHLTQSPSGTRLSLFAWGSIGFRTFLNHAIFSAYQNVSAPCDLLSRPRHVVARPFAHPVQLLHEVVERVIAPRQVELRRLDHQQRRGVVVEEEV